MPPAAKGKVIDSFTHKGDVYKRELVRPMRCQVMLVALIQRLMQVYVMFLRRRPVRPRTAVRARWRALRAWRNGSTTFFYGASLGCGRQHVLLHIRALSRRCHHFATMPELLKRNMLRTHHSLPRSLVLAGGQDQGNQADRRQLYHSVRRLVL